MQSKQKPYLRLVWPRVVSGEAPGASWFTLVQGLKSDGWRSVSVEELRQLPNIPCEVVGWRSPSGETIYWVKDAPTTLLSKP